MPAIRVMIRLKSSNALLREDWGKPDKNGYYTITYKVKADTDRYYRLRGTNLGTDVEGYTSDGDR